MRLHGLDQGAQPGDFGLERAHAGREVGVGGRQGGRQGVGFRGQGLRRLAREQLRVTGLTPARLARQPDDVRPFRPGHQVLDGRFNLAWDDLRENYLASLRHRVILNFEAQVQRVDVDGVLREVYESQRRPS
jgi:MoxR-like ATPase